LAEGQQNVLKKRDMGLEELEEGCRAGSYYEPLQAFRSLLSRKINGPKKDFNAASQMIASGVEISARHGLADVAFDIAKEFVSACVSCRCPFDQSTLARLKDIDSAFRTTSNTEQGRIKLLRAEADFIHELNNRWFRQAQKTLGPKKEDLEWLLRRRTEIFVALFSFEGVLGDLVAAFRTVVSTTSEQHIAEVFSVMIQQVKQQEFFPLSHIFISEFRRSPKVLPISEKEGDRILRDAFFAMEPPPRCHALRRVLVAWFSVATSDCTEAYRQKAVRALLRRYPQCQTL
jgi:hypothetical protein